MKINPLPILSDNYVFIISQDHEAYVVDPGESTTVFKYLEEHKLALKGILLTHHHHDHIGGVQDLAASFKCQVYAPLLEKRSIPFADVYLNKGDRLKIFKEQAEVFHWPGHTHGHLAYYIPSQKALFSGDVVFGLGCGRLFEGTYAEMFKSLQELLTLPDDTRIYCTHEYTLTNIAFCESLAPELATPTKIFDAYKQQAQQKRRDHKPTVPLLLQAEREANPFLRATSLGEFQKLRELRNRF